MTEMLLQSQFDQLPFGGGERNYILPHIFVRIPVFSARGHRGSNKRPVFTTKTELGTWGVSTDTPCRVYQTKGERLDQQEATIYAEFARVAELLPPERSDRHFARAVLAEADILRVLANDTKRDSGTAPDRLAAHIDRMVEATFIFDFKRLERLTTHLIHRSSRKLIKGRVFYEVYLEAGIARAFAEGWSLINMAQRSALHRYPIAQALHAFYCTHQQSFFMSTSTLKKLVDCQTQREDEWLKKLIKNLSIMQTVTGWRVVRHLPATSQVEVRRETSPLMLEEIKEAKNKVHAKAELKARREKEQVAREAVKAKAIARQQKRAEYTANKASQTVVGAVVVKKPPRQKSFFEMTDAEAAKHLAKHQAEAKRVRDLDPEAYDSEPL